MRRVLLGEKRAVSELYREYAPSVKRYVAGKIANEEDAQEILQDTFMSILDSLPLYRGESSLKTWMISIARHEVLDFYRKRYVRKIVEKTSPLFDEVVGELSSPEFEMKKKQIKQKFDGAYRSLTKEHQDILSYRYELGMSVKQAAGRMGMTFKATESLLFRARMALKHAYTYG